MPRMAVVGAGLAGLTCARSLGSAGVDATVFDKGRRPGGRISTRRTDVGRFDHGAQYFSARDPRFERQVRAWLDHGVVAEWQGRFGTLRDGVVGPDPRPGTRLTGAPTMSALAHDLAAGLNVQSGVAVARIERSAGAWRLWADDGRAVGEFDTVLVATPAPQAAALLQAVPALAAQAAQAELSPCIALLATFGPAGLELPLDGAFVEASPLSWIARDSSKPGRAGPDTWVAHATPGWSAAHLEDDPRELVPALLDALGAAVGTGAPQPSFCDLHRWRFALPTRPLEARAVFDPQSGLGFCGDWCGGARIESAFLSGLDCADRVLRRVHR